MYTKDHTNVSYLHPLSTDRTKSQDKTQNLSHLDPFGEQVWSTALELLEDQEQFTVKEVLDAFEHQGIQTSESVIRDRLSDLMESGRLNCLPGSGRRPAYYSLISNNDLTSPQEDFLDLAGEEDTQAWEYLVKREAELLAKIEDLQVNLKLARDNMAALKRVIEFKADIQGKAKANLGESEDV